MAPALASLRRPIAAGTGALVVVLVVNLVELLAVPGRFPGYGFYGLASLLVLGAAAVLLALLLGPVEGVTERTVGLLALGALLLAGFVPLYLAFGCVFYGCPG